MLINMEHLLDIAFELTLFVLFLILCIYFFKTKILPSIYEQINNYINYKKSLIEKSDLLNDTMKALECDMEKESVMLANLESKIKIWQSKKIEANNRIEDESKELFAKLENKRKQQINNLTSIKMQKIVIPQAIDDAKLALESEGKKREEAFKKLMEAFESKFENKII